MNPENPNRPIRCRWPRVTARGWIFFLRHRVHVSETPIYLDTLLADKLLTGRLEPRLIEDS